MSSFCTKLAPMLFFKMWLNVIAMFFQEKKKKSKNSIWSKEANLLFPESVDFQV